MRCCCPDTVADSQKTIDVEETWGSPQVAWKTMLDRVVSPDIHVSTVHGQKLS